MLLGIIQIRKKLMRRKNPGIKLVSRPEGGIEIINRKIELEKQLTFECIVYSYFKARWSLHRKPCYL